MREESSSREENGVMQPPLKVLFKMLHERRCTHAT